MNEVGDSRFRGTAASQRPEQQGGRNNANSHNASTAAFRMEHSRRLGDWLESRRPESSRGRLLDFGCADLLLGLRLDGIWLVDGYDEWEQARAAGREQQAGLRAPGVVFDRLEDVPRGAYDAVILNSLFQYVPDAAAAEALFAKVAPTLASDASVGIVITDAVSDGANWFVDLRDLLTFCSRTGGLLRGVIGAYQGMRSGKPAKRHRIPQVELEQAASTVGLELTRHPESLTGFSRRATFILRHHPAG
jgi:hypothetical protein